MKKLLILLSILLSQPLSAVQVTGLYQTEVPVDSQDQGERGQALSTALGRVIVKVAGRQEVMGNPEIRKALASPSSYLKEYRYQSIPSQADSELPGQALWVQFDDAVINRLLESAGVRLWGRARPNMLLWLALEDPQQKKRKLVSAGNGALQYRLKNWAADRGVPLILPLLDATDRRNVSTSDVWGGFAGPLVSASGRYQADAILSAKAAGASGGGWRVDWLLQAKGYNKKWSSQGNGLYSALKQGIDAAVNRLADVYLQAIDGYHEGPLELAVVGIQDVQAYARVNQYLNDLDVIDSARILYAEVDRISFQVDAPYGQEAVEQAIGLGNTLEREPGELDWIFRLRP